MVVADQRSPRDGRVIEMLGHYNPQTQPSTIVIDRERLDHWIERGAQPTNTIRRLMRTENTVAAVPPTAPRPHPAEPGDEAEAPAGRGRRRAEPSRAATGGRPPPEADARLPSPRPTATPRPTDRGLCRAMEDLLEYLARSIVDDPDAVVVESFEEDDGTIVLELEVAEGDAGKVIGRGGRTIAALRTVVKASAVKEDRRVLVDVLD